jgi:hypothetical protein
MGGSWRRRPPSGSRIAAAVSRVRDHGPVIADADRAREAGACGGRPSRWNTGMSYTFRTGSPGIVGVHADRCPARDGQECTCGPQGYRASVEDPESGEPVLSPTLDTLAEARAWRHEQRDAFDAWRAASEERPTVDSVVEDLLSAAARGSARDRYGRRFDAEGLRALRWALSGHVHEELGSMAIAEVRARHVQALVDRLDAGGLSQRRVDAVVAALRSLFAYAGERELVESNPADAIALPDEDEEAPAPALTAPALTALTAPAPAAVPAAPVPGPAAATGPIASPPPGFVSEQVIWTSLKAVTLIFILIALVLVAESV